MLITDHGRFTSFLDEIFVKIEGTIPLAQTARPTDGEIDPPSISLDSVVDTVSNLIQPTTDILSIQSKPSLPSAVDTTALDKNAHSIQNVPSEEKSSGTISNEKSRTKNNLVLGLAFDTDAKYFAVFCGSFHKYAINANAVVFINTPVSAQHTDIASKNRVQIIETDVQKIEPSYLRKYHPSSLRWILFHRYLSENNRYRLFNYIWLNDVRDTVFQSNPFDMLNFMKYNDDMRTNSARSNFFYAFEEEGFLSISDCEWNKNWISDCFDEQTYLDVQDKTILCSGASVGTVETVVRYVEVMSKILSGENIPESNIMNYFPRCERNGVDQGIHNVIMHKNLIPSIKILSGFNDIAIHMQSASAYILDFSPVQVFNGNNTLLPVVHQYDRSFTLTSSLASEYVSWVNMSYPDEEWKKEPSCAPYQRVHNIDLFEGKGDVKMLRVISAASCCIVCTEMRKLATNNIQAKNCNSFVFKDGECYLKHCDEDDINAQYMISLAGNISKNMPAVTNMSIDTQLISAYLIPV
jgi:hypothetical protein